MSVVAVLCGARRDAAAQDIRVEIKVAVPKHVVDEVRRLVDVEILRHIGHEVRAAISEAVVDLPHLDGLRWSDWQDRSYRIEQTDRETRTLALGPTGSLELRNLVGDITVVAGTGRDVTVEVFRRSRGRTEADAKLGLDQVKVEVDQRGERATVEARYPQQRGRSPYAVSVSYNVTVPSGTHVTVDSTSGGVSLKGIKGALAANVISGDITISDATRVSSAKTISGKVMVTDVSAESTLDVSTISGGISLERVRARRLLATATSGSIIARDITADTVGLKTIVGSIEYAGTLSRTGRYELQTQTGPIRLIVPADSSFDLEARTFSGQIRPDPSMLLRGLTSSRTSLRGTVGSGGAVVVATTFSGGITVTRR